MIPYETKPGKIVYCIDAAGKEDSLTVGSSYVLRHWDGCCIHVIGDDGVGCTVNRDRFELPAHVASQPA